jgi:hypothetical protein
MVLPLIPAVLIAVGAATGSGGLALGGKGALDLKKASGQLKEARSRYERRHARSEQSVAATNRRLEDLREQQKRALSDVVIRMIDFLRRHEKQVRENERLLVDGIDADITHVPGLARLDVDAVAWVGGVLRAAGAAAGANAGALAVANGIGIAGTGTPISALWGVAAENAALAWLGGGSLAAGGGGMALGAAALNFVTVGPALLLGGFVTKNQGTKALTKSKAYQAKVAVAVAELDQTDARLAAVGARADELKSVLERLTERAVAALDLLESEPFDAQVHAPRFQRAINLVMAVRDVAAAPVIDARSGKPTEQSANLIVKYRPMTEEPEDA